MLDHVHRRLEGRRQPVAGERLADAAVADETAIAEDDDAVGGERQRQVVDGAHNADAAALGLLTQQPNDVLLVRRIQMRGRLVEQHHGSFHGQRAREMHSLALASRQG